MTSKSFGLCQVALMVLEGCMGPGEEEPCQAHRGPSHVFTALCETVPQLLQRGLLPKLLLILFAISHRASLAGTAPCSHERTLPDLSVTHYTKNQPQVLLLNSLPKCTEHPACTSSKELKATARVRGTGLSSDGVSWRETL